MSTSSKFKASWPKKCKFGPIFDEKSLNFEKFSMNSSQKTRIEQFSNPPLSLEIKSLTLQLTVLTHFIKINENMVKNTENVIKKTAASRLISTKF